MNLFLALMNSLVGSGALPTMTGDRTTKGPSTSEAQCSALGVGAVIVLILQLGKQRHREVR